MKDVGTVRRLLYRDGLSISEIERRAGLTRKMISKWLSAPERTEPKIQATQARSPGQTGWGNGECDWPGPSIPSALSLCFGHADANRDGRRGRRGRRSGALISTHSCRH